MAPKTLRLLTIALLTLCVAAAQRVNVSIKDNAYRPATVRIAPGATVVWTNDDNRDYTVVAADGSFASGNLKPGQTFTVKFPNKGTFNYGCKLHPRMAGRVVVE